MMDIKFTKDLKESLIYYSAVKDILKANYKNITFEDPTFHEDYVGSDIWMKTPSRRLALDLKIRRGKDLKKHKNIDDFVLEIEAYDDSPGWTVDNKKITDYVVWYFVETGRCEIVNYKQLRKFTQNAVKNKKLKPIFQETGSVWTLITRDELISNGISIKTLSELT